MKDGLLNRTLTSMVLGGFVKPWLFVDQAQELLDYEGKYPTVEDQISGVTLRVPGVRTAGHWVLSMWELWIREPAADRYAIFQDDHVMCINTKHYIERSTYPKDGYLNLYTFPGNETGKGWYPTVNQLGWSATGLVFNRDAVQALFSHNYLMTRFTNSKRGHKSIDGGVVDAMRRVGYKEYVHSPSLLQHTGDVSSMGNKKQPVSQTFPGEDFDALELLK